MKKDAIFSYSPIWPFPINNRIKARLLYTNIKALWFWTCHILSFPLLWGMWSHEHTMLLECLPVLFQSGFFAWNCFNFTFPLVYISGSQTFLECLSSEDFARIQMLVYEVWHWFPNCLFLPSSILFFPLPISSLHFACPAGDWIQGLWQAKLVNCIVTWLFHWPHKGLLNTHLDKMLSSLKLFLNFSGRTWLLSSYPYSSPCLCWEALGFLFFCCVRSTHWSHLGRETLLWQVASISCPAEKSVEPMLD